MMPCRAAAGTAPKWYALKVKSRHEKIVSRSLRGKGFEEFVPLYHKRAPWSGRGRDVDLPLFAGYVFCQIDLNDRLPILTTPGVVSIVKFGETFVPVETAEIEAIQSIIASGQRAMPWPYLREGQKIRIKQGCLKGMEGILLEIKSQLRLVVSVTILQRSVAVEVDREVIAPVI